MNRRFASALFLVSLAGCAAEGAFPSLAPRPAEKLSMDEPVRPTPLVAPDPALGRQIDDLLRQARSGHAEYEERLPAARTASGAAGASGSESWIEAQQALSRLEAARAPTVTALAELDALSVRRASLPINARDFAALQAALENAGGLVRDQQQAIDRLRLSIGSR